MQKRIISLLVIIIVLSGLYTNVFAFDLKTNLNSTKTNENGVQLILRVSDLSENIEGINAVSGKLVYDSNIFEKVNFTGLNNWSAVYNDEEENENRGKFVLITTSGNITEDTDIANVELILKPNISNIQTQIKVEEIQTSYKSKIIDGNEKVLNIEINNNEIKILENKANNLNSSNAKYTNNTYIFIILFVIVIILILIIFLIKKSKEKKTNEK